MNTTVVGVVAGLAVLVFTVELLRRHALREKYAVLWLVVALTGVVFTVFPDLLFFVSEKLGFVIPSNLVFAIAAFVLLVVGMQLSLEVGRLEDRAQRLAEELALMRLDVDELRAAAGTSTVRADDDPAPAATRSDDTATVSADDVAESASDVRSE